MLVCSQSFFVTRRHPLSLTLFPYTTLFRSRAEHALHQRAHPLGNRRAEEKIPHPPRIRHHRFVRTQRILLRLRRLRPADRKSTRLNSSHRCISYAVFCLKKKNSLIGGAHVG